MLVCYGIASIVVVVIIDRAVNTRNQVEIELKKQSFFFILEVKHPESSSSQGANGI